MQKLGEDVKNCRAHYLFTIDVSGSMDQFESVMIPCLKNFINALPDNDRVTILPFGKDVHTTIAGYSVVISQDTKSDVCRELEKIYKHPNYAKDMKDHTNIFKAVDATAKQILQNRKDYQVIVSIFGTDFQNNIPTKGGNFRTFTSDELETMKKGWRNAVGDSYIRTIALEINEKGGDNSALKGYVLTDLRDQVFSFSKNGLEVVPVGVSSQTLNDWFKNMNQEIMITKLKSVVENENKAGQVCLTTSTNIDGKTHAYVSWTPTRLYEKMKIDSSFVNEEGFYFANDTANYGCWMDQQKELELGQVKHEHWGFHHLNDSINIGVSLPSDCDEELTRLSIEKPLTSAKASSEQWIFTFFLPFWLTATICGLLLLYLILVVRAFFRNKNMKLNCTIEINDKETGESLLSRPHKIKGKDGVTTVGDNGQYKCTERDVSWMIQLTKESPYPFLFMKKPYWSLKACEGYVKCGQRVLDYKDNVSTTLQCGADRYTLSETVKITMKKDE